MIPRLLENSIQRALTGRRKVLVLYGPRQVGKTTLLGSLRPRLDGRVLVLNGDYLDDQARLRPERNALELLLRGYDYLIVDEAQNVPEIGRCLKLIHDHFELRVIATGSSSFDLARRTGEPLSGRQRTFLLFPLSYAELDPEIHTSQTVLEEAMLYGAYPEVVGLSNTEDKCAHLRQLVADALLKDIFAHVDVNRRKLLDILRLLALQIGSEVSISELARTVRIDSKTVARYVDLLEDAFVLMRLRGFSRNLRKEVGKSQKLYFLDLGIRNAILNRFEQLAVRDDRGALWENLLVIERVKANAYRGVAANYYFWRTYDQQEIDMIEEVGTELRAFEFKWKRSRRSFPKAFVESYPNAETRAVDLEGAHSFLLA